MTCETRDKDLLRSMFARNPIAAVYQLADFDEPYFSHSRWFVCESGALLLYSGLAVTVLLPFGDVTELAGRVPLPERFYAKLSGGEQSLLQEFDLTQPDELYVMGLEELVPARAPVNLRLVADAREIEPLYEHYPGNYFDPAQVASGVYAVAEVEGVAVAAGGTHAYAPNEGAAALGNVVTSTSQRGRGIARALVTFLCEELLRRGCRHIGLHVSRTNAAAITCYRGAGFTIHSSITQWLASRR